MKIYYVYILANKRNGTLYIGVTNNIHRRTEEHKLGINNGFTKKYQVYSLVYFEETHNVSEAIQREKQLKHWKREWKIKIIEQSNPCWIDLSLDGF